MSGKTEAELALQRKYELLRKKKEEKAKQQANKRNEEQQAQMSAASPSLQPSAAKVEEAAPSKTLTPHEKALQALKRASKGGSSGASSQSASQTGSQLQRPPGSIPQNKQTGTSRPSEDGSKPKLSPMEAAKQALAAKNKQSAPSAARKLPGVKRPLVKRPAPPVVTPPAGAEDAPDGQNAKRQRASEAAGPSGREEEAAPPPATLFVGDLPPFFTSEGLHAVFSQLARVTDARVVSNKLFGFVTLESKEAAAYVLDTGDTQGIYAEGQPLRVSRAHDGTNDWQQTGPGGDNTYHAHTPGAQDDEGYNPYEHPKVREARLAARSLAEQIDLAQLPGMNCGPPPERALVCYDDL